MMAFIWKIRFALHFRHITEGEIPWRVCWQGAEAWFESNKGDTSECPKDCAETELDAWRESQ